MSTGHEHLHGTLLDDETLFSLHEFCHACGVRSELIIEMVDEGVLHPGGNAPEDWCFRGSAVTRAQKALRLSRDLSVNWPGAALALDLLEELEQLRARLRRLEGQGP